MVRFIKNIFILFIVIISFVFVNYALAATANSSTSQSNTKSSSSQTTVKTKDGWTCKTGINGLECTNPKEPNVKKFINYLCKGGTKVVPVAECVVGGIFNPNDPRDVECACCGTCSFERPLGLGLTLVQWIFRFSAVAAFAVFVYGGFLWLLSGGNTEKVQQGRKAIVAAIVGIIIIFGAWIFINTYLKFLVSSNKNIKPVDNNYIKSIQQNFSK